MIRKKSYFKDYLRGRFWLQLFSLGAAISLWLFVNSGQQVEEKRAVRIQYTRMPPNLTFERTPLKEVSIGLVGPLYRLRSLSEDDLTYLVDLSNARAGTTRVELSLDALKLPLDLEATFPNPRIFFVYLEELTTRELPVRPSFEGELEDGFSISDIRLSPPTVQVTGPRSLLSRLEFIPVDVDLRGRKGPFNLTVKPRVPAPTVEVNASVYLEIDISTVKSLREYQAVSVKTTGGRTRVDPAVGTVIVEGPQRDLQTLTWTPEIVIDTKDLKRGRFLLRGRVEAPPGLRVLEVRPSQFLVEVLP
jgi:YbbR domain-containing protein